MNAGAAVLTGAGALALGTSFPWAVALAFAVAVIAGGAGERDSGVRILLRDRRPATNDWLLERWVRTGNVTTTNQLTPEQGENLFSRFKDTVLQTLMQAPLPRRSPTPPRIRYALPTVRFLLQQDDVISGASGFTLFMYDPQRNNLIQRPIDMVNGELLLQRCNADIAQVLAGFGGPAFP